CGMRKDKDNAAPLHALQSAVYAWYFAHLTVPRGTTAETLAQYVPAAVIGKPILRGCFTSVAAAFAQAQQDALVMAEQPVLVLVCGSFYTVGQIPNLE